MIVSRINNVSMISPQTPRITNVIRSTRTDSKVCIDWPNAAAVNFSSTTLQSQYPHAQLAQNTR